MFSLAISDVDFDLGAGVEETRAEDNFNPSAKFFTHVLVIVFGEVDLNPAESEAGRVREQWELAGSA